MILIGASITFNKGARSMQLDRLFSTHGIFGEYSALQDTERNKEAEFLELFGLLRVLVCIVKPRLNGIFMHGCWSTCTRLLFFSFEYCWRGQNIAMNKYSRNFSRWNKK